MLKGDVILRDDIEVEIFRAWHFNPYKFDYQGSSINRYSSEIDYECLNCNYVMHTSFSKLEDMWKKHGWYCPKCQGSFNPVYEEKLPNELAETNSDLIPDLDAEYSIMSGIEEHLGCKPYEFKNINKGRSVRLQHRPCSSIFTATPTMLYNQFKIKDKYSGEDLVTPYCPKCNYILEHDGVSYSGSRFLEKLHNWFEDLKVEFPYTFSEDAIYRFKDYSKPIVVTCAYCGHSFTAKPEDLFTTSGDSKCEVCGGKSRPNDSGDGAVNDVDRDNRESKLEAATVDKTETVEQNEKTESSDKPEIEPLTSSPEKGLSEDDLFVGDADKPISSPELVNILDKETRTQEIKPVNDLEKEYIHNDPQTDSNKMNEPEAVDSVDKPSDEQDSVKLNELSFDTVMDTLYPEPGSNEQVSDTQPENDEETHESPVEPEQEISNESSSDIVAVETDVDKLVDDLAQEIAAEKSSETGNEPESVASQSPIIDFGGYPLDYNPTLVQPEVPEFANPQMVDTPETRELVADVEEKPETFEEMANSMHEIFEDLEIKKPDSAEENVIVPIPETNSDDDDDDPNLGIPDEEDEDAEIASDLADRLGEGILPRRMAEPQDIIPGKDSSLSGMTAPSFEGYQMRHPLDFPPISGMTAAPQFSEIQSMPKVSGVQIEQPDQQVDMIQTNQPSDDGFGNSDVNWTDVWDNL